MEKKIYVIRHCEAEGQPSEASLTNRGHKQAIELAKFFTNIKIDRVITSPLLRAIQSIEPLVENKKMKLEIDSRLSERILSVKDLPDWLEKLKATFINMDLKFEGGESSNEAAYRIVSVVKDILNSENKNTIIVTHGNLMSLLLNDINQDFGFEQWKNLSNPDVFLLHFINNKLSFERVWPSLLLQYLECE